METLLSLFCSISLFTCFLVKNLLFQSLYFRYGYMKVHCASFYASILVIPRKPTDIKQIPYSGKSKIRISWTLDVHDAPKLLPTIGFEVKLGLSHNCIKLKIKDIQKKNINRSDGLHYFEESFLIDEKENFSVLIRAYNSFTHGEFGTLASAKVGFIGIEILLPYPYKALDNSFLFFS